MMLHHINLMFALTLAGSFLSWFHYIVELLKLMTTNVLTCAVDNDRHFSCTVTIVSFIHN